MFLRVKAHAGPVYLVRYFMKAFCTSILCTVFSLLSIDEPSVKTDLFCLYLVCAGMGHMQIYRTRVEPRPRPCGIPGCMTTTAI